MIVLDASVAVKWFVEDEPRVEEANSILESVRLAPHEYLVPELFMAECIAVLSRLQGATAGGVQTMIADLLSLGIQRVGHGSDLLEQAAVFAVEWDLSGYDAIYVALAALTDSVWLTADGRAARRVKRKALVRVL